MVKHLLEHTAGWPKTSSRRAPNPMAIHENLDREQLIDHVIRSSTGPSAR